MLTDVVIANRNYTRLSVAENETVDEIALKVMKQDCPDFLLPIRTLEIDGEMEIRYEQQEGVRLCYSSLKMSKRNSQPCWRTCSCPSRYATTGSWTIIIFCWTPTISFWEGTTIP